ncbi:hypothetical protein [Kaarinaea lacus]
MKKNTITILLTILILLLSASAGYAETTKPEPGFWGWFFTYKRMKEVAPIKEALYNDECGSCHFPYQAGLLPEGSWRKLLDAKALEDHFGDNAELDDKTRKQLLDILVAHSAEKSWYKRSRKVMWSLNKDEAPLRITKVPYIEDKHKEVYEKVVKNSKKVKSLSYCDKCHMRADKARYDDDTVVIPDYGTWTW